MENKYPVSPRVAISDSCPSFNPDAEAFQARANGWSGARQRRFCEHLAESGNVSEAAHAVGMSREGAYQFRRRTAGRAFGVAWEAALRIARKRLVDDVFELARYGIHETLYKDGEIVAERRRRDPRVLLTTIERLARLEAREDQIIKCVTEEFDEYLDCLSPEPAMPQPAMPASNEGDAEGPALSDEDLQQQKAREEADAEASEEDRKVARAAAGFFDARMPCKATNYSAAERVETLVQSLERFGGVKRPEDMDGADGTQDGKQDGTAGEDGQSFPAASTPQPPRGRHH